MQLISILASIAAIILAIMNYHNVVTVNLLSQKFAGLMNLSVHTFSFDLAFYTIIIFILGMDVVFFFFAPLYKSLKDKYSAYKRELERGSISNTNAEAKIKVLENKISVLEKALEDALNNK